MGPGVIAQPPATGASGAAIWIKVCWLPEPWPGSMTNTSPANRSDVSLERAQFFIAVYELCLVAELAHICVDIRTHSGAGAGGVPSVVDGDSMIEFSRDGDFRSTLIEIDGNRIALDEVAACTILVPSATRGDK